MYQQTYYSKHRFPDPPDNEWKVWAAVFIGFAVLMMTIIYFL